MFNKIRFSEEDLEVMKTEIQNLYKLDHPKIIKFIETYDDKKYTYLVMEHVEGIPLYEKISM